MKKIIILSFILMFLAGCGIITMKQIPVEQKKVEIIEEDTDIPITYYVDASLGNDNNDGKSENSSWKTIDKVNNNKFKPGDKILFKRGETWREQLAPTSSGTQDKPITFGAYGTGTKPIISANNIISSWKRVSLGAASIYYTSDSSLPGSVVYDGQLLTNVGAKSSLATKSWWYDSTYKRVYIYDNPASHVVEVSSARTSAVTTNGQSYITFDGLDLQGSGHRRGRAVYLDSSYTTVRNCDVHNAFYGIVTSSTSGDYGTIENNHVYDCYNNGVTPNSADSTGWVIRDNEIDHCGTIQSSQLLKGLYPQGIFVCMKDIIIEHNNVHDIAGKPSTPGFQHGIYTWGTKSIIKYNMFRNCSWNGIKLSYGSNDSLIHHNLFIDNSCGIAVSSSAGANIYNNVIKGSGFIGIQVLNESGTQAGSIQNLKNNIFYENYYLNRPNQIVVFDTSTIVNSDNNLFFETTKNDLEQFIYQGTEYTFSEWQALGFDANSLNVDPKFVSSTDFHLQSDSPSVDAGAYVGLTEDYEGNTVTVRPNIGAFEK